MKRRDKRNVPPELEENSEQLFSEDCSRSPWYRRGNSTSRLADRVQAAHHRRI